VTPEWLVSSIEQDRWLEETPFLLPGSGYVEAAARAAVAPRSLLHGIKVHYHLTKGAKKVPQRLVTNPESMRRLVLALGGKWMSSGGTCDVVLIAGAEGEDLGDDVPKAVGKQSQIVAVEWLVQSAEKYELVPKDDFNVVRHKAK